MRAICGLEVGGLVETVLELGLERPVIGSMKVGLHLVAAYHAISFQRFKLK